MAELNKRRRYIHLWKSLRNKYKPTGNPPIYLIEGHYSVAYESGYHWVVGYCPTLIMAERTVLKLKNELKEARRYLGPHSKIVHILYDEYDKAEKLVGYGSPEIQLHKDLWNKADNKFRELIDIEVSKMTDQNIPFPYSKIIPWNRNRGGPITYSTRAIYDI